MAKKPYHGKIPTMVKFPGRNKIWVVLKPLYIYIYRYCPKATFTPRARLSV
jgi:hypothetical protein